MGKKDIHLKEFVLFQLQRNIINLYKRYIILTEDLHHEHSIFLKKLKDEGVSEDLIKKLDYFNDEKYTYMRKRILDVGNEVNRDLHKYFELIDLDLNKEKLDETQKFRLSNLIKLGKNTRVKYTEPASGKGKTQVKGKLI